MQQTLKEQILTVIRPELCLDETTYHKFLSLLNTGKIIKEDSPMHHVCVFFIPFNPITKELFIVDHKKAKQWIIPGGHIEKGELVEQTVKREVKEELGISISNVEKPILFTIMDINNDGTSCKTHYDIWHLIPTTDPLYPDMIEFHNTKWVPISEVKNSITHSVYLQALQKLHLV